MSEWIGEYQVWLAGFVLFLCMMAGLMLYTMVCINEDEDDR